MKPLVMSCGDPSGIGPEIAVRARQALGQDVPFGWIGDPLHLPAGTQWQEIDTPAAAAFVPADTLPVLAHPFPAKARPAAPDPANASEIVASIARGVAMVQAGAGFAFPGHTEFLADLAGGVPVVMMLACAALRVVPVTIHIPLADVPRALTPALLEQSLRITYAALQRDFGIAAPRLAIAGLNPHAGEGGTMGQEETTLIAPVLDRLRAEGMAIMGPLPADTMFHPAARAHYDAAVCMYHDQALIPIKTIDFAGGVNVTLGLPFIRTSPDHGTAYDIAGKNVADPSSLIAALRMATDMAKRRG